MEIIVTQREAVCKQLSGEGEAPRVTHIPSGSDVTATGFTISFL